MRRLLFATVVMLLSAPAVAKAPAVTDPDLAPWFQRQVDNQGRSCCGQGDGHILKNEGDDWKVVGENYWILAYGRWQMVPYSKVNLNNDGNPTGGAVAFYSTPFENGVTIYCFIRPVEG